VPIGRLGAVAAAIVFSILAPAARALPSARVWVTIDARPRLARALRRVQTGGAPQRWSAADAAVRG